MKANVTVWVPLDPADSVFSGVYEDMTIEGQPHLGDGVIVQGYRGIIDKLLMHEDTGVIEIEATEADCYERRIRLPT